MGCVYVKLQPVSSCLGLPWLNIIGLFVLHFSITVTSLVRGEARGEIFIGDMMMRLGLLVIFWLLLKLEAKVGAEMLAFNEEGLRKSNSYFLEAGSSGTNTLLWQHNRPDKKFLT